ncbi:unnamed protein product [Brachionus calyciflorus]|uniref:RZ-type domain-containing protein n=1 Tax=Brachionus calyciflorus TaxID=104777 RepID=A0A813X764_9BILA|nr:unnamed protein product [Brachionus calyciflorus]
MNRIVTNLNKWVKEITEISEKYGFGLARFMNKQKLKPSDIFIGFTDETIPSLVYKFSKEKYADQILNYENDNDWLDATQKVEELVKILLLQSSTSDGIIRLVHEVKANEKSNEKFNFIIDNYYKVQAHENFNSFFQKYLFTDQVDTNFIQITTHSKLLSKKGLIKSPQVTFRIESLLSFDSQQQFTQVLREFYETNLKIAMPKITGGCMSNFQTSKWFCYHIDDLQNNINIGDILSYKDKSLGEIFQETLVENNTLNFQMFLNILKSIIYNWCSRIVDNYTNYKMSESDEFKNRSIERIEILLNLFREAELGREFSHILLKHISRLQIERELALSSPQLSKSWVLNEVSKISNVIKYATLKNSCQNYIETRVTHLLSGLISLIDCNYNLDLLINPKKPWLRNFWLKMFNDEEFMNLNYKNYYLQANNTEKIDFICFNNFNLIKNIQIERNTLKLSLPFSWKIKEHLDQLTHLKIKELELFKNSDIDNSTHLNEQLINAFKESLLRVKLNEFFDLNEENSNYKNEFLMFYLNDFILMENSDSFLNLKHFNLIKNRLFNYYKTNYSRLTNDLDMLIGIHCSFENLKQELKLFAKFVQLEPKCVDIISKSDNQNSNLCFLAARIVTKEYSEPSVEMKMDQWDEWFDKVQKSSVLIDHFFELFPDLKEANFEEFNSLWERCTVLKLYIENLCHNNQELYKRCINFWKSFDKIVNFKRDETFSKFIKNLSLIAKFGENTILKDAIKCEGCDSNRINSLYTTNICSQCFICLKCIEESRTNKRCSKCSILLSDDDVTKLNSFKSKDNSSCLKNLDLFKTNLNCYFMDVIKTLCFSRSSQLLPDEKVIQTIIDYLLPRSKKDNTVLILDLGITPSIKSTLFQLLLNYNEDLMKNYLIRIFSKSRKYLEENYEENDLVSLKLMYLNALEDNLYSRGTVNLSEENFNLDIQLAVGFLNDLLRGHVDTDNNDDVSRLKLIAKIKFCLATCSKLVVNYDTENKHHLDLIGLTKRFIDINQHVLWFRFYFIKNVFRRHGKAELLRLANEDETRDLVPFNLTQEANNVPNTYVLCGNEYKNIRNSISDSLINGDFRKLLETNKANRKNVTYFFLAYFEKITLMDGLIENENDKCKQLLDILCDSFKEQKSCFEPLLTKDELPMGRNKQNLDLSIQMLLMHLKILMHKNQKKSLLELFKKIIQDPSSFKNSYLPSIPHDDDYEAYKAFANNGKETIAWYHCSDGHLYTIGDCTKPATVSKCPTCGKPIGGRSYNLEAGNVKVENITEKQTKGYSLDDQDLRKIQKRSIRNMGFLNTTLLRLLLDCSLYLSAKQNLNHTSQIINSPIIDIKDVQEFFLKRIKSDLKILSDCIDHSPEESLLLVHFILNKMDQDDHQADGFDLKMNEQKHRNNYEAKFCTYINETVLKTDSSEKLIQKFNNLITEDAKNNNTDHLFKIAYDLINVPQSDDDSEFYNQKELWSFRRQITLDSMINSFKLFINNKNKDHYKLLDQFINRLDELKALKYLPSIYKMLNIFYSIFNRQIDRQNGMKLRLKDILENNSSLNMDRNLKKQVENGARNFLKAWKLLSANISSRLDTKIVKHLNTNNTLLKEISVEEFTELPICYLISSTSNEGLFIYSLMFYLINLQNEFIEFYIGSIREKSIRDYTNIIDLENVTSSDCISFSVDKDLLRLIYIHSNYSLENSKNLNLEFDYAKIQDSIEKRFLMERPLIKPDGIPLIDYSDNIKDWKRFEALDRKIKQEELSFVIKDKISMFYKQPNQLNDIIRKLNIVIDFIISSGCSKNKKIMEYAVDTLKMTNIDENNINKQINELDVTYLKSLWNILNLRRVILLTEHRQDPFDQLDENFKQSITRDIIEKSDVDINVKPNEDDSQEEEDLENDLIEYISKNKYPKTENILNILEVLYRNIAYKLISDSKSQDNDDIILDENMPIEFIFSSDLDDDIFAKNDIDLNNINLKEIKLKNIFHLWKIFVKIFLNNCRTV